jgi:PKD repeat protein
MKRFHKICSMPIYFELLLVTLLLTTGIACKKKEVPSTPSSPVFYFDGLVDSNPLLLQAGVNDIYMFSTVSKDLKGLYTFGGKFAPKNCDTCEPSLAVEINANVQINSQIIADVTALSNQTIFNSYSIDSVASNTKLYNILCTPHFTANILSYAWNFNDGTPIITNASPMHTFTTGGTKNITLITTYPGGADTITQTLFLNSNYDMDTLSVLQLDTTKFLNIKANNTNYTNYTWNFGDGTTANGQNASHTYSANKKHTLTLTATSLTDTNISRLRISTENTPFVLPTFSTTKTVTNLPVYAERVNLMSAIITLKQNGKIYKSYKKDASINQSANKIFKLSSFNQYLPNELGQNTIQLKGETDVYLYNIANPSDSVLLRSSNMSFAVALP